MTKVAIMGYGTIGSGVFEVLTKNSDFISKKAGCPIEIKYVLDLKDLSADAAGPYWTKDVTDLINDDQLDIVVETMGGTKPAYDFVKQLLLAKKSVCTSNKELVATHGAELLALAEANDVNFLFEASVGGGIPIIRPLNVCLTSDEVDEITGILNGTTNYILTKMDKDGREFDEVLKVAQEKGFAERNPDADVEGHDACRKIAILTSMVTGKHVDYEDIYTEGITKITTEDFLYADKLGLSIKLLASSKKTDDSYCVGVAPHMLDEDHALHQVSGVFNAILVKGDMYNNLMFYGKGAGKLPTASAVVADVVEAAKFPKGHVLSGWTGKKLELTDYQKSVKKFFIRLVKDETALEKAREAFGQVTMVSVESLPGEFGLITDMMSEEEFADRASRAGQILSRIRLA